MLDSTIFQFSTEYSEAIDYLPIIGSLVGAVVSGLIAITIFIIGNTIEKKRGKINTLQKLIEQEEYLRVQLITVCEKASEQATSLQDYLIKLKIELEQDIILKAVTGFNPIEIKTVNDQDQFKLLVHNREGNTNIKVGLFKDFRNSVLYLINAKENIPSSFKELNQKTENFISKYKDSLEFIVRKFEEFGVMAEKNNVIIGDDPFLDSYENIVKELKTIENYQDIFISYNSLLHPLLKVCKDKNKVAGDVRVPVIIREVMNAIHQMKSLQNANRFYFEYFNSISQDLNLNAQKAQASFNKLCENKLIVN